jgi:MFS family permease
MFRQGAVATAHGQDRGLLHLAGLMELSAAPSQRQRSRAKTVTLLGVTQIFAWGSSYYLPAVLGVAISSNTGWPLSLVVGGLSLGLVVGGLVSPMVGSRIGDGHGRTVLAASAICIGLGLLLLAVAPSLPIYLSAWIIIGVGMGAGLYDAAFSVLGTLYGLEARRTITALTLFGGLASTVCWPLSAFLLEHLGWRGTCLVYACIQLGVSLPAYILLLPSPPPIAVDREPVATAKPRLIESNHLAAFLILGASISLAALISTTLSVHLLVVLQADGMTLAGAVALGAIIGPCQVTARFIEMIFGARYHAIWTKLAATSLVTSGVFLLWSGAPFLALGLMLYGCGIGLESIARGALPLALFGANGYGARMGRLALPSLVAQAIAPFLGAWLLTIGGGDLTLTVLVMLAAINVGLVLILRGAAVTRSGGATA